jgi:hypothetical protein
MGPNYRFGKTQALVLGLVVLAIGCAPATPGDLDRDARAFMNLARVGDTSRAFPLIEHADTMVALRPVFARTQQFLSRFPPDSARLIGWNVLGMGDTRRGELTYELHGDSLWGLFAIAITRTSGHTGVIGFHWQPLATSLEAANSFTLTHKSFKHLGFLLLAILAAAASIGGAVLALRTRLGWRWVLLSLLGVTKISLNWNTGGLQVQPIAVQLFSAGFLRPGFVGPWLISFSLPLGALLVFVKWRRKTRIPPASPGSHSAVAA